MHAWWMGGATASAGGQFTFKHGNLVTNSYMYATGYPAGFGGPGPDELPLLCTNPIVDLNSTFKFRVDCEGGGGFSGSPWVRWGTSDAYAVSNGAHYYVPPPNTYYPLGSPWCDAGSCLDVFLPVHQEHYWHTFATKTEWDNLP